MQRRLGWSVSIFVFILATAHQAEALCRIQRCPDQQAIDSVRALAAEQCGCLTASDHESYVSCAKDVVRAAVRDGRLGRRCLTRVVRCESNGPCGSATEGFADSNGVRIHHVSLGTGPLVVMIHGFPDFWFTWHRQMAALADDHQVVAIDTRGYNLSDKPAGVEQYALPLLMDDVAAVIAQFGQQRAIIVGHDWGALIAWSLAMERPQLVEHAITLNVPHPRGFQRELATNPQQAAASAYARALQADGSHTFLTAELLAAIVGDAEHNDRYIEAFQRSDFEALVNYYKANFPTEPYVEDTSPVVKIAAPVLVLHGLADPFLLPAGYNGTWEWLDGDLTMKMIPGSGHWVQREAAEVVTATLVDWLRR